MPLLNHPTFGDVQGCEYFQGTMQAIDGDTDTCTVEITGGIFTALIFYHCSPNALIRTTGIGKGAITGGAGGFAVGDSVIVLKNSDNSKVYVIAHTDGIRSCGGSPWVKGRNVYGCLGVGTDYYIETQADPPRWYEYEVACIAKILWDRTAGYSYRLWISNLTFYYTPTGNTMIGGGWDPRVLREYVLDESRLPVIDTITHFPSLNWSEWRVSKIVNFPTGMIYYHKALWTPSVGITMFFWSNVGDYTKLNLPGSYKWASIHFGSSFLIKSDGKMYCCGGNYAGELGIGATTGEVEITELPYLAYKPAYYTTMFVEVHNPGPWSMVSVHSDGYFDKYTWALKTDGTLWITGYGGGGMTLDQDPWPQILPDITTFTQKGTDVWECFDIVSRTFWKIVGPNYKIYHLSNTGVFNLIETITPAALLIRNRGFTLSQMMAAKEGVKPTGNTFIGGGYLDSYDEIPGTLCKNYEWAPEGLDPVLAAQGSWMFAAGAELGDHYGVIALKT